MEQLKAMLEQYRNGERALPSYQELAALAYAEAAPGQPEAVPVLPQVAG